MEITNITGTGVISPDFTTESARAPETRQEQPVQNERSERPQATDDVRGNNLDITA